MILITDILFPSKYAKWRIEGIKALIDELNADVLVRKVDAYAGVQYDVDYDEMLDYFNLSKFNIIIFDPKYNYLNKYNTRIDGTLFNGKSTYSYLFTTNTDFEIKNYSKVFHIFLSSFIKFNTDFTFDHSAQYLHLYPGGGYASKASLAAIPKDVNIISTQPFCTNHLINQKHENYITAYGSTCLPDSFVPQYKNMNTGRLKVCFSNMGDPLHKGSAVYTQIVNTYKKLYPMHDIEFLYVGSNYNQKNDPNITYIEKMAQSKLDEFYNKHIDILINMENGVALNGWPLGVEAALQGTVLITTDTHNCNSYFKYPSNSLVICTPSKLNVILSTINDLYMDRKKLNDMSILTQNHTISHFTYALQQRKIIDYIKTKRKSSAEKNYRVFCPEFKVENDIFSLSGSAFNDTSITCVKPNIKDLILDNIKNDTPFSMARYNDGEWIAALRIKENNLYSIHQPKWGDAGQAYVDNNLMPIIKEGPKYLIGIASEVLKKPYMMNHIYPYIKELQLFDGGLFARMSISGDLHELLDTLAQKRVIVVGPQYLLRLCNKFNFFHVSVPESNIWEHHHSIDGMLNNLITAISPNIILYSCSFVAKKLIHDIYSKHSNIIQLDLGAALDPFCGVSSRPWHKFIKEIT